MKKEQLANALLLISVAEAKYFLKSELVLKDPKQIGEVVITRAQDYLKGGDLPNEWDLRTQGMLTADLNQHIPVYCGSCT